MNRVHTVCQCPSWTSEPREGGRESIKARTKKSIDAFVVFLSWPHRVPADIVPRVIHNSRLFCLTGGLSWGIRHDSWGRPLPAFSCSSRLQNRPVSTPNVLTLRDVRSHTRTHTHTRLSKILFFSLFHNIAGRKISNRIMENNNYLIFVWFLKLIFLRVFDTYILWEEIWEIYYSFVIEFFFLFRSSYQPSFNDCVTGSNISNTEIWVTIVCSLAQFLSEIHCERVNFIQWNMLQRNN